MKISEATEYLAKVLRDYLVKTAPEDIGILFLDEVRRIVEFRDQGDLNAWETAVLGVFSDTEWEEFEKRTDFGVFEYVWEVGRINMYCAIDANRTKKCYQHAAMFLKDFTGLSVLNSEHFNFSEW